LCIITSYTFLRDAPSSTHFAKHRVMSPIHYHQLTGIIAGTTLPHRRSHATRTFQTAHTRDEDRTACSPFSNTQTSFHGKFGIPLGKKNPIPFRYLPRVRLKHFGIFRISCCESPNSPQIQLRCSTARVKFLHSCFRTSDFGHFNTENVQRVHHL
jgi:hypothetical protein